MTDHRLSVAYPQPSGWRAVCTCGWHARGHDRAEATTAFLEHAEQAHATITEDNQ